MTTSPSSFDRRSLLRGGVATAGAVALGSLLPGTAEAHGSHRPAPLPREIALPNGFRPEDIAAGRNGSFYVGSLATGAIFRGSFRTGEGRVLVPSADGPSVGVYVERRGEHRDRLWVGGGPSGVARVHDAHTGALLATYRLAPADSGSFISDVVVTRYAAYYTDAFRARFYVIPLGRHGRLPGQAAVRVLPVTGDVTYQTGPNSFNLNGIAEVDGRLVTAQTTTGQLFTINPSTGRTRRIDLVDAAGQPTTVAGADGFVARGRTLVIAQNFPEKIAVVRLGRHLQQARLVRTLTDPRLDIPSSVEVYGGAAFALNARFTTPPTADTAYSIVRLSLWA